MILNIGLMVVSVALIGIILLQAQGTGLGKAWGGSGGSYHSKRGMERGLFILTVVLALIFAGLSAVNVF